MHQHHPRRVRIGGNLAHPVLPDGAIWAARQAFGRPASPYANPHKVGKPCKPCGDTIHDLDQALHLYADHLDDHRELVAQAAMDSLNVGPAPTYVTGKDFAFACWCPLDQPCHVDLLLTEIDAYWLIGFHG